MILVLFIFTISIFSHVGGQICQGRYNKTIVGHCSLVDDCQGSLLDISSCERKRCCINVIPPTKPLQCLENGSFASLYNKTHERFLKQFLDEGIQLAGICQNCHAKAAFLAISATMTDDFTTDEATGISAAFTIDDGKYGNTKSGDGSRFRRRGFFGLRGRAMYEKMNTLRPHYQLVSTPESAAVAPISMDIAAQLWNNPNLMNGKFFVLVSSFFLCKAYKLRLKKCYSVVKEDSMKKIHWTSGNNWYIAGVQIPIMSNSCESFFGCLPVSL